MGFSSLESPLEPKRRLQANPHIIELVEALFEYSTGRGALVLDLISPARRWCAIR